MLKQSKYDDEKKVEANNGSSNPIVWLEPEVERWTECHEVNVLNQFSSHSFLFVSISHPFLKIRGKGEQNWDGSY